ncbi:hypothetical protein TNCV_2228971 [Trichonephila clavipes]|nr:hypothetical protein TNCV_2228971 [Trichonephila clavipes]
MNYLVLRNESVKLSFKLILTFGEEEIIEKLIPIVSDYDVAGSIYIVPGGFELRDGASTVYCIGYQRVLNTDVPTPSNAVRHTQLSNCIHVALGSHFPQEGVLLRFPRAPRESTTLGGMPSVLERDGDIDFIYQVRSRSTRVGNLVFVQDSAFECSSSLDSYEDPIVVHLPCRKLVWK